MRIFFLLLFIIHGLKTREVFEEIEKPTLAPLPTEQFEITTWKGARVHVDQYIQFEKAFYSVPNQFVGCDLWVRGTEKLVQIYDDDHQLIKTHLRSKQKRHTDPNDFPKNFQLMMQDHHVRSLIRRSERVGEHFKQLIVAILTPHAKLNTRRAMAIDKSIGIDQLRNRTYVPLHRLVLIERNNAYTQEGLGVELVIIFQERL